MAFFVVVNLVWWVTRTRWLLRVLEGQMLAILAGHLPIALVLWFTVVVAVLVAPPVVATWLIWRRDPRWGLAIAALPPLIAYGVARWGSGFFPLVTGPGGYYIRSLPFGGP